MIKVDTHTHKKYDSNMQMRQEASKSNEIFKEVQSK